MAKHSSRVYLITGGAGFVGCHLTRLLLKEGHSVVSLDNFENSSMDNVKEFLRQDKYWFYRKDIVGDKVFLDKQIRRADIIIHLAASVGVANATDNPSGMLRANILGMMNVIDLCAINGKRLLVSSSSEVYGWSPKSPFEEEAELVVPNPKFTRFSYALSKLVEEYYTVGFMKSHGLPVTIIRLFNSTGVGQNSRHNLVLPRMVFQALQGLPITVYGTGKQTRCFCDVKESVVAIYLLSLSDKAIGEVVNIGTDEPTEIMELARMIKVLSRSPSEIVNVPYKEAFGTGFLDMEQRVPDLTKIYGMIKWRAEKPVEHIVSEVIAYEKTRRRIQ